MEYKDFCWNSHLEITHLPSVHQLAKSLSNYELTVSDVQGRVSEISNPKNELTTTCLPSVYMAGFPTSDSDYVFDLLTQHPILVSGREKEPHFWSRFPFENQEYDTYAFLTYLANFVQTDQDFLPTYRRKAVSAIDASQSVLWDTRRCNNLCAIPEFLKNFTPNAKFIVLMRNPVDQIYSDYWNYTLRCNSMIKGKAKKKVLRKAFLPLVSKEIEYLEDCVKRKTIGECIHNNLLTPKSFTGCSKIHIGIGIYVVHLKRWLKYFKKEQFLFLRLEDIISNPYNVFIKVWKFLGVESLPEEEFSHITSKTRRAVSRYPDMHKDVRSLLNNFYSPFNIELANLLNNTGFLWK